MQFTGGKYSFPFSFLTLVFFPFTPLADLENVFTLTFSLPSSESTSISSVTFEACRRGLDFACVPFVETDLAVAAPDLALERVLMLDAGVLLRSSRTRWESEDTKS